MKTDDDSGEAGEPPEEPPSSESSARTFECEENEELQWARRHAACAPAQRRESRPAGVKAKTAARPAAAEATFRKTELWNRPPLFRSEEPVVRQKTLLRVIGQEYAIPYTSYEDALRNLTAAILQRQETIARGLAREVDELHDRLDVLEDRMEVTINHLDRRLSSLEKERES
jgi:hypothetical protein